MSTLSLPVLRLTPIAFGIALACTFPAAAGAQQATSAANAAPDATVLPSINVTGATWPPA